MEKIVWKISLEFLIIPENREVLKNKRKRCPVRIQDPK